MTFFIIKNILESTKNYCQLGILALPENVTLLFPVADCIYIVPAYSHSWGKLRKNACQLFSNNTQ